MLRLALLSTLFIAKNATLAPPLPGAFFGSFAENWPISTRLAPRNGWFWRRNLDLVTTKAFGSQASSSARARRGLVKRDLFELPSRGLRLVKRDLFELPSRGLRLVKGADS
jgi:hypothetical protein